MLLYALLHLTGYDLPIDELKRFRQLHSKTPGHPEFGPTPGVETTTGPLGQGLANAVGMALAEKLLAAEFNRPGHAIVDHRTYAFVGDGCLMEGISHEACSLAGTWGLGKLMVLYDDNGISIDGETKGWFTDDTPGRFEAYGWNVIRDVDGHDVDGGRPRDRATGHRVTDRPTLICCKTVIGKGSPQQGGYRGGARRGAGREGSRATRVELGWTHPPFVIPDAIYAGWNARERGALAGGGVGGALRALSRRASRPRRRIHAAHARRAPRDTGAKRRSAFVRAQAAKGETVATRKASQQAIEAYAKALPELLGGSADLTGSVFTNWSGSKTVTRESAGNYIHFGVREFAMCAIANGMALHGGLHPLCRHLPHVFRLRAQRAADGGADEAAVDLRVHPRFDRPGRGRPDAPVGRARGEPAPHSEHGCLAALRHRGDRRCLGRGHRARRRPRRACCSRGRTFRSRRATTRRSRRYVVAATCWPTGMAPARSAQ